MNDPGLNNFNHLGQNINILQGGENSSSRPSFSYKPSRELSKPSFMTAVFILEIILALSMAVIFYVKSSGKLRQGAKPPPGYEINIRNENK